MVIERKEKASKQSLGLSQNICLKIFKKTRYPGHWWPPGDHVWVRPGAVGRQGHGRASWWVGPGWWREGGAATWSWSSSSSSTATSAGQHAGYAHEPASQFVIPIIYVWQEQLALLNFASKRPWKQQLLFTIVLHLEKKIVGSDLKTEYLLWLYYFYPSSLALSHEPVDCSYNSTWCDM